MKTKNLHIFLQSTLVSHGGGIESWLDYFLKENINYNYYAKIFIYAFENSSNSEDLVKKYAEFSKIKFETTPLILSKPGSGPINLLSFYRHHAKNLSKNSNDLDHVIFIGSIVFAPFLLFINKIIKQKNLFLITWIRSNSLGEIKVSGSKFSKIAPFFERYVLKKSNKIITNGNDTLNLYLRLYPKFKLKIKCVPNAVEVNKFIDIPIVFKNNPIKVAYLGRYVKAKGFDKYVESIKLFEQKYPQLLKEIKFLSFGYGEIKITTDLLENRGKYTTDNLIPIFAEVDAVVFLNQSNFSGGLSHALLEVMAAGKLIIAWNNEVHNQVLTDKNSILIDENNVTDLVDCFQNLTEINNESVFLEKRKHVRKLSKKHSTAQHFLNYLESIEQ